VEKEFVRLRKDSGTTDDATFGRAEGRGG